MSETYAFLFCLALGIAGRFIFLAANLLAKRTDLLPVTVILDALTVMLVGGGFTLYVGLSGTVLAPYMFAALFSGYLFTYWLTKPRPRADGDKPAPKKSKRKSKTKA